MRLIDGNKLLETYKKWIPQLLSKEDEGDRRGVETCIMVLEDMQTVDAVPVVRCRECKHHRDKNEQERQYLVEDILICTSPDATEDCWNAVWPDHFCSYGEKEGADND